MEPYKLHNNEDKTWRSWIRTNGKNLDKLFYKALVKVKKIEDKNLRLLQMSQRLLTK